MKFNPKIIFPLMLIYGLILSASSLAHQAAKQPQIYYAVAYQGCDEVKRVTLTAEQAKNWQDILNVQSEMLAVHKPLISVEEKAEELGEEMQHITEEAFSWENDKFSMDRRVMFAQEQLTAQISRLMANHKDEFRQLEILGAEIETLTEAFESYINQSFVDVDFETIEVFSDEEKSSHWHCSNDRELM